MRVARAGCAARDSAFVASVALVVVLGAAASACRPGSAPSEPDAGAAPECATRAECDGGLVCAAQRCVGCDSPGQCSLRETCDARERRCVLREGWGSACTRNEDCQAGEWCRQGLCLARAEVSLCPSAKSSECPARQRCNTLNGVCEEDLGCGTDLDCGSGEVCNVGLRACVPRCTPDTQGSVCAAGERCVNERCAQCATSAECQPGLVCDSAGRCSAAGRCYSDRDCQVPLACFQQTGACLPKAPPCVSDDSCAENQRCELSTGRCVPRACQPDPYEPNDARTSAFSVKASRYVDLTLCPGDLDFFALALGRGDQLGVNLDADPFAENTFTTLVQDQAGRTLASGKLLAAYVAPAAATYYVAISTTDDVQPYDVTFLLSRGTPCDDDSLEPNDLPAQATPLNSATSVDGAVCPQDRDHFAITVPAGRGLRASLANYSAAAGLLRLCVLDGEVQLSCSDEPQPELSVGSLEAAGKRLTLRVAGSTERIANTYTLRVELP